MARIDESKRMREATAALPRTLRAVFRLHAVDGLDYAAIGERLGIDAAEVERSLAEAIVRIDAQLRRPPDDGGPDDR